VSAHTPGPWVVDYALSYGHIKTLGYQSERGSTPTVARYDIKGVSIGIDEQQANARLIAAAPELLEALQNLIETCEYGDKKRPKRQI